MIVRLSRECECGFMVSASGKDEAEATSNLIHNTQDHTDSRRHR